MAFDAKEYYRQYKLDRFVATHARSIEYLGGKCAVCGTTEGLQIDHIDRSTKSFNISARTCLSWERIEAELTKCQCLCGPHHKEKSDREQTLPHGEGKWGRRGCKCSPCMEARRTSSREYMRRYRAEKKAAKPL